MRIYSDGKKGGKIDPYWDNVHFNLGEEERLIKALCEATILHEDELTKFHRDWIERFCKKFFDEKTNIYRGLYDSIVEIYGELKVDFIPFVINGRPDRGGWYDIPSIKKDPERHAWRIDRRQMKREAAATKYSALFTDILEGKAKVRASKFPIFS
jgi:hypothetical protein